MVGKTLNVCGELPEAKALESKVFKGVIGGEPQSTEFKNQNAFTFRPLAAQWFGSNFLPNSRDSTTGFLRRWLILHFSREVPASEKITNYHEVLVAEEREAIAAWAIQGFARLGKQRDYTLPVSHDELIAAVQRSNNTVAAWLENNGKVLPTRDKADEADAQGLWEHFSWYMRETQGVPKTQLPNIERFKQMVLELGFHGVRYVDPLGVARFKLFGIKNTVPIKVES
jgi:phage/plasmid-associated DNA primase